MRRPLRLRRFRALALASLACIAWGSVQAARLTAQNASVVAGLPPSSAARLLTGTGLILGRVVDASSNAPVQGAVVTLTTATAAPLAPSTGSPPPQRVLTNGDGRFLFRDLPAGRFNVAVTAPGYANGSYGQRRPGGASQTIDVDDNNEKVGDVTLRVWKPAVISGAVVDESGEPVVETGVTAMRVETVAGRRRVTTSGSGTTDDRGFYRIVGLMPGDYVVAMQTTATTMPAATLDATERSVRTGSMAFAGSNSGAPLALGSGYAVGDLVLMTSAVNGRATRIPAPAEDGRVFVYPTIFFPSTGVLREATVLTVASGEEHANVDFQIGLAPAVRVSGLVTGPDGAAPNLGVRLISAGLEDLSLETGFETATTVTDAQGQFTLLGVPPGQYTIKVINVPRVVNSATTIVSVESGNGGIMTMMTSTGSGPNGPPPPPLPADPTLWAITPVSVGDSDLLNLRLTLQPGLRITGHIELDVTGTKPTADQIQRMMVTLDSADGRSTGAFAQGRGQFDATGQFKSTGLVPGKYVLRLQASGSWTLKSAIVNGRDISDQPLTLDSGDVNGLVVTLTDHPSDVLGSVRDAAGAPDRSASVLVFPADRERWTDNGASPRSERLVRTSPTGVYRISGLPPGDYCLIALDDIATGNWTDPKFLDAAAGTATRVRVTDSGGSKTQDLRTSQLR